MATNTMRKPVRLEINNSGAWKLLGTFDAADEGQTDEVLNAAEALVTAFNWGGFGRHTATLRVSTDEPLPCVLMRWQHEHGWRDVDARAAA